MIIRNEELGVRSFGETSFPIIKCRIIGEASLPNLKYVDENNKLL